MYSGIGGAGDRTETGMPSMGRGGLDELRLRVPLEGAGPEGRRGEREGVVPPRPSLDGGVTPVRARAASAAAVRGVMDGMARVVLGRSG